MENKTAKYFKYAVGEIILVVIGILIALQINNWNEDTKDRVYEKKMLWEVINAIKEDEKHYETMFKRIKILDSSVNYFMLMCKNNVKYSDTMYRQIFGLNSGASYEINSGPYQAIKSSGMDKISNDSLRNLLINFYDFKLPLYKGNYDHINRNHQKNIEDLLVLLGERAIEGNGEENFVSFTAIPKDLFQKQEFLGILSNIKWRNDNNERLFSNTLEQLKTLKHNIASEIKDD